MTKREAAKVKPFDYVWTKPPLRRRPAEVEKVIDESLMKGRHPLFLVRYCDGDEPTHDVITYRLLQTNYTTVVDWDWGTVD